MYRCKNFDSNLVKESATRLTFLECNRCGARMSVQNVEKGFHATNRFVTSMLTNIHARDRHLSLSLFLFLFLSLSLSVSVSFSVSVSVLSSSSLNV